jgi:hypothetical protein
MPSPRVRRLRLPEKFAFTALSCAMATTIACSGHTDGGSKNGPQDAGPVAHDSAADCEGGGAYCGGGPCPSSGAFYCGTQCPAGCEPFA